jgi:hypothetical protein
MGDLGSLSRVRHVVLQVTARVLVIPDEGLPCSSSEFLARCGLRSDMKDTAVGSISRMNTKTN